LPVNVPLKKLLSYSQLQGNPKSVSRNPRVQRGPEIALLACCPVRLNAEGTPARLGQAFIFLYSKRATAHMAFADIFKTRKHSSFTAIGVLGSKREGGAGEGCACRAEDTQGACETPSLRP